MVSSYEFEPSSVYLLEHGKLELQVMEMLPGAVNGTKSQVPVGDDDLGLVFEVKDPEILRLDDKTGNMTALKQGETYIFLKNKEGEVLKGMPIWVTTAHKVNITSNPHPESKQLIKGNEYDIHVDILTKEGKAIHPSPVRKAGKCALYQITGFFLPEHSG